jgi:hypothetical protein
MKRMSYGVVLMAALAIGQDANQKTNSFFDDSEARVFPLNTILVDGEVENPGPVDRGALPVRSRPVKEVTLEGGKPAFKGAFYYSGIALYDILDGKKVKKSADNNFSPFVDLYVVVQNDRGEQAAFSWGEIYYSRDNFAILLSKRVQAVNPSKMAVTKWPLPTSPRLVCANDLWNARFLTNPTKITVRSFRGTFASPKPTSIYSPEIAVVAGSKSFNVREIASSMEKRTYDNVGYGHGMGYKGIEEVKGILLKDILAANLKLLPEDLRQGIAVVSAKDGYRCVFSLSEIANRNDNLDFLLVDDKDSKQDGRFSLFAAPDFFVDRNVKAIEKIEIVRLK